MLCRVFVFAVVRRYFLAVDAEADICEHADALGLMAVLVRQELVFLIMAGVFVMETVSVILQVASFKLTGRRLFRMAPLHHHFELKGWAEPKVIVRFWIITVVLVLVGLATLKIR